MPPLGPPLAITTKQDLPASTTHADPAGTIKIGLNESTALLFGFVMLLIGAVLWSVRAPNTENADFSITYVGAKIVHDGHGAALYDLREQAKVKNSLYARPQPLIYEHPPFEALLLAPLARLPYRKAYLVWAIINASVWLALALILRPHAPVPKDTLGYFALWLLFAPLGVALYQGQSSLILLLLYAATFLNLKLGRPLAAGIFLGLALFKFQFVLPFAVIFLLRRQWKFLTGFAASAVFLGILSLIAVGWQGALSYVHLLLAIGNNPGNLSYGSAVDMPTLQGFVYAVLGRTFGAGIVSIVVATVSVFLILVTAWQWNRVERKTDSAVAFDLMFAAAIAVSLMTGFHMFTHDFSPLILALFLAAAHFPAPRRGLRVALVSSLVLFWIPPSYFLLVAAHRLYMMFPVLLVFFLSVIVWAATPTGHLVLEGDRVPAR